MAKKAKNDIPNPNSVSNRDVIQRLNFLYQASVYLNNAQLSSQPAAAKPLTTKKEKQRSKKNRTVKLGDLSRSYIETMKTVGTKTTVQLDPSIKRTLCKGCNNVLIPGSTASVRTKKSSTHGHIMVYTCTGCKHAYRIPATPILAPGQLPITLEPVVTMEVDSGSPSSNAVQSTSQVAISDSAMPAAAENSVPMAKPKTRKRKGKEIPPRLPPLFARDAGHVVFAGNEQLPPSNGSWNDGIFIT